MKFSQRAVASFVLVGVASVATTADAETSGAKHLNVSLEGPEAAVFEECPRGAGERKCEYICTLPCTAVITSDPVARHRIVDGTSIHKIFIRGEEGESRVVRYERGSPAGTPVLVGGVLVSGAGVVLLVAGFLKALSTIDIYGCGGDRLCEMERAKPSGKDDEIRSTGSTMVGVGAGMIVVGALGIVVGAVSGRPSSTVSSPAVDARGTRGPVRAPMWARPELALPPNHTKLFELRF